MKKKQLSKQEVHEAFKVVATDLGFMRTELDEYIFPFSIMVQSLFCACYLAEYKSENTEILIKSYNMLIKDGYYYEVE